MSVSSAKKQKEMLTKEHINQLKAKDLPKLYQLLQKANGNGEAIFVLENLGYLPKGFDGNVLLPFLEKDNPQVRLGAVKNLGKLADFAYLNALFRVAKEDSNSTVRREAVSSIGRMRNQNALPFLWDLLNDEDPKVVLQVVRALLVFRDDPATQRKLKGLFSHPNEMIQSMIKREFYSSDKLPKPKQKHIESYDFMKNVVVQGDVREIFKYVPDESIHLTFTSPPYYNARDYSVYQSYNDYLEFLASVFKEVHRATKEGRFFLLNTSPVIVPRVSRQHSSKRYPIPFDIHHYLVEMGWEFIDDIIWLKPEACVKNRNGGFQQHRKPLGYKPNAVTEYVMVYRKKTDKLLDWNMREYDWETVKQSRVSEKFETTNVWRIDPSFDKVHSAVFPIELCNRIIKFYSYKGDLVFDPFSGSGTFGRAAATLDRYFFLTEQEKTYIERTKQTLGARNLFSDHQTRFLTMQEFQKLSEAHNDIN